jgi:hypothetical protein
VQVIWLGPVRGDGQHAPFGQHYVNSPVVQSHTRIDNRVAIEPLKDEGLL